MPLVSIVLPTYNRAHLIRRSIDTCLSQTLKDIELIIVNDCSTDDTAAILDEYACRDGRIRVIHNDTNYKLPASLNRGFAIAKGKYYTWTSDDNLYAPNALEVLSQVLENQPETDLVYGDYTEIDENDRPTGTGRMNDINESFMLWKGCGSCFMYKAMVHTTNKGYDPALFLIEDYDFFLRASLHFKFMYLRRSDLYQHRIHPGSLTSLQGHVVFELQKIIIERKQALLLPGFSNKDKILFYRKYAVYYGVLKNNAARMNHYLSLLRRQNTRSYLTTIIFIPLKKIASFFTITFGILKGLFIRNN